MIKRKAYKFRLKPNEKQRQQMIEIAGSCRFVWNKVLHLSLKRLENKHSILWYYEADFWTKLWKSSEEYSFLKAVPAHCIQQKLKDLDRAFRKGFDKSQPNKRLPRSKRRHRDDSFRFPEPKQFKVENRRIKLPKLGWIGFVKSAEIIGEIKNATITKNSGHWYLSIQVEQEKEIPIHSSTSCVGIDLGIAKFAALSDGKMIESPHAYKKWEARLSKSQRQLSKKIKFSSNWKNQQRRVQKLHNKISHVRKDFLNKTSTNISKNHAIVVVEELKITNMSGSAKGTVEKPGRNVKAKSGLNKCIQDQGWGEFRRQLEYKLEWLGGELLRVAPHHTSQRCHRCGYTAKENRLDQKTFHCLDCGLEMNADENAAKNIEAAGHAVLACGDRGLSQSVKQEPPGKGD